MSEKVKSPNNLGLFGALLKDAVEVLLLPIYYSYILILINLNYQLEKYKYINIVNRNTYIEMERAKSHKFERPALAGIICLTYLTSNVDPI